MLECLVSDCKGFLLRANTSLDCERGLWEMVVHGYVALDEYFEDPLVHLLKVIDHKCRR